jgi:hypothetical protein
MLRPSRASTGRSAWPTELDPPEVTAVQKVAVSCRISNYQHPVNTSCTCGLKMRLEISVRPTRQSRFPCDLTLSRPSSHS